MQIKLFKKKKYVSGLFAFHTDVGRVRINNEDQATALTNAYGNTMLVVCDGMGGQNKGDFASNLAISCITDSFISARKFLNSWHARYWLVGALRNANATIFNEASKNAAYNGMGTTISIALIYHDKLITAQVGDSRIYRLNEASGVEQLTEDQTYVGYLYRTGQITKEEMKTHPKRHMLMNALGIYPSINVDIKVFPYIDETLLLCSDGLYNNVTETTMTSILRGDDTPEQKVMELISIGNSNGGSDNLAAVVWEAKHYGD